MRYSSFFVLLVHILFIRCKDFDTFSSNQEISMRMIQPKIRIPIYSSTKTSQSNLFAPSKSHSENVYIDPVKKYKLETVNIDRSWHVFCGSHEKKCDSYGSRSWCCASNQVCGTYRDCLRSSSYKRSSSDTGVVGIFLIIACSVWCCTYCWARSESSHSEDNPPENSAVNNSSTIRRVRFSIQPFPVSTSFAMNRQQNTIDYPLRHLRTQSLIRTTPRSNSIPSLEQPPPEYDNSNIRRETTISLEEQVPSLPPPYNDVIQQSSTTITMEQQSLLPPPTYDDSIRGTYL